MKTIVKKSLIKKVVHEKGMRISNKTIDTLITLITDDIHEIIDDIIAITKHAKRKTIKIEDVNTYKKVIGGDNNGDQDNTNNK